MKSFFPEPTQKQKTNWCYKICEIGVTKFTKLIKSLQGTNFLIKVIIAYLDLRVNVKSVQLSIMANLWSLETKKIN